MASFSVRTQSIPPGHTQALCSESSVIVSYRIFCENESRGTGEEMIKNHFTGRECYVKMHGLLQRSTTENVTFCNVTLCNFFLQLTQHMHTCSLPARSLPQ